MKTLFRVLITLIIAAGLLAPSAAVFAQDAGPGCGDGPAMENCSSFDGGVDAQAAAGFKAVFSKTLKGGYVAHGIGMRNLGGGKITVDDVPADAKVYKAYLFWSLLAPSTMKGFYYNKGKINGSSITGSLVRTAVAPKYTSVPGKLYAMAYRADVTSKMKKGGNGIYQLSGFASGITDGNEPYDTGAVPPLLDGATLVIVYSKSLAPLTTIKIYNGAATTGQGLPQNLHLVVPGIKTGTVTGLSKATFIVAEGDGKTDEGEGAKLFDTDLALTWSGVSVTNGQGGTFDNGNYWDTITVDLADKIQAPEEEFWFTVSSKEDDIVWVAQVVSYATGDQDSDGDKLKDAWEMHGINGLDLPDMGADPLHKDLFIEADYMAGDGHDHLLDKAHLDDIVATFDQAPVSNPDGRPGINIHIDTGGAVYGTDVKEDSFDLGGGNDIPEQTFIGATTYYGDFDWSNFQEIKDDNFALNRVGIFHYMIFAHDLVNDSEWIGTSGISRNGWPDKTFVKGATDFIVSMGSWDNDKTPEVEMGTQEEREGTFVHELGHNLGLRHGGNDHVNYKPNYFSVMNYFYQTLGVGRDGAWHYDYSRIAPTITETSLSEAKGIPGIGEYIVRWVCPFKDPDNPEYMATGITLTGGPIDWNCNGYLDKGSKRLDVNYDGRSTTLKTQNNWASITFAGGGIIGRPSLVGSLAVESLMVTKPTGCLTVEDAQKFEKEGFYGVTP